MSAPGDLVRDGKKDILESQGQNHNWHEADPDEYRRLLRVRLIEEAAEAADAAASGDHDRLAAELADVVEVVLALGVAHGVSPGEVRNQAVIRKASEGGFEGRLVWDGPADAAAEAATKVHEASKVLQYRVV